MEDHQPRKRSEDEIIAAAIAGEVMEGSAPTPDDIASLRRVLRGESTVEEELEKFREELRRRKE